MFCLLVLVSVLRFVVDVTRAFFWLRAVALLLGFGRDGLLDDEPGGMPRWSKDKGFGVPGSVRSMNRI